RGHPSLRPARGRGEGGTSPPGAGFLPHRPGHHGRRRADPAARLAAMTPVLLYLPVLALLATPQAPAPVDPEVRIVEYLRRNVKPGQRVVVSDLYNGVFTAPGERAALNRLFDTFFKIPLFAAQYQKATGQPPSLKEIAEQFRFRVPGEADVMLRIIESDPRMPKFLERNAETGEIERVHVEAIL